MGFYLPTENPCVMMRENVKTRSCEYIVIYQDELQYFTDHCTPHIILPPPPLSSMYIALYKLYTKLLFRTKYISEFVSSCTFQQYIIWQWQPIILVKQLIL